MAGPAGGVVAAGDAELAFTIQSISKPFVFALALDELGRDEVIRHVGVEPSGEPFNAISLEPSTGRPANPLINAGAIATTALVARADPSARASAIVAGLSRFAGRELTTDEAVYASESAPATAIARSRTCCARIASSTATRTTWWRRTSGSAHCS